MAKQPRIAIYVDEETIAKFKIVAALNGLSMTKYLENLVKEKIKEFKVDDISNININSKTYLLHKIKFALSAKSPMVPATPQIYGKKEKDEAKDHVHLFLRKGASCFFFAWKSVLYVL